jgi:hypothetical protein
MVAYNSRAACDEVHGPHALGDRWRVEATGEQASADTFISQND